MAGKRGVSFYSYQVAFRTGRMNLEDCVRAVAEMGADGIELLAMQTPPATYPEAKPEEVAAWQELMEKYHTKPVCFDSVLIVKPLKQGMPTPSGPQVHMGASLAEQISLMRTEIDFCSALGFPIMRIPVIYGIQMEAIEAVLPYAEEKNVNLGQEIHVPFQIHGEYVDTMMNLIERTGTKYASLIPDAAIFAHTLPKPLVRKALSDGAAPVFVQEIVAAFESHTEIGAFCASNDAERELLAFAERNVTSRVEELKDIAPYISHVHAKFYEMKNGIETGIDYEKLIAVLRKIGYNGYLCSEFEGQRMFGEETVDEVEQVRQQHEMLARLW